MKQTKDFGTFTACMNSKIILIFFLVNVLAVSCKNSKETIRPESEDLTENLELTEVAEIHRIPFFDVLISDDFAGNELLEKISDYKLYTFNQNEFLDYVSFQRKKSETLVLELPHPLGEFQEFVLTNSSTMSKELQEKYPQIVAMKGSALNGDQIRLDINEKGLFVEVRPVSNYENVWYIAPISKSVYVLYFKKNMENIREDN